VDYLIPKEGTVLFVDMMAIPKDAEHVEDAYAFLNYIMVPEVIAKATNYLSYANGNEASMPFISPAIAKNPNIYPPEDVKKKLYTLKIMPSKIERVMTRTWISIRTGH